MTKQCESQEMGVGARCAFLDRHGGDHRYPAPGQDLSDAIRWRAAADQRDELEKAKNGAYDERNRCVAAMAKMGIALGWTCGIGVHDVTNEPDGWDPEWLNIVYIDTPAGQASWHIHDRDLTLFAHLPRYEKPWDGHTPLQKYKRLELITTRAWDELDPGIRTEMTPCADEVRTKRFFRAFDGGSTFSFVATGLEHAQKLLADSGTEIEHDLAWCEMSAQQAAEKMCNRDDGNPSIPLDQCDLGEWFSSEW